MNTVWLTPVFALLVYYYKSIIAGTGKGQIWLAVLTLGLLTAAIPDHYNCSTIMPYFANILDFKYLISETLIIVSLLQLLLMGNFKGAEKP
jgi:hypothetical protein